jgi:hypothetical protein
VGRGRFRQTLARSHCRRAGVGFSGGGSLRRRFLHRHVDAVILLILALGIIVVILFVCVFESVAKEMDL